MANTLYDLGREKFLNAQIDWTDDTIKVALVDTGIYTFSQSHEFASSISSAIVGTAQTLTGKSTTGGVADGGDVTFSALSGSTVEAVVIYKDASPLGSAPLIAYIDTATGLPLTPSGTDVTIVWDDGANKIFKL
jgi:hypothetical protein